VIYRITASAHHLIHHLIHHLGHHLVHHLVHLAVASFLLITQPAAAVAPTVAPAAIVVLVRAP